MRRESLQSDPAPNTCGYSVFLAELRQALQNGHGTPAEPLLNGRAGAQCQELLTETVRQKLGAFFTPSPMAERMVSLLTVRDWNGVVVFDPACGAGDLLLPVARQLPIRATASQTLRLWNRQLFGCDVSREFVQAARMRLVLLATTRGARADKQPRQLCALLTNTKIADGLRVRDAYQRCTHVLMNPPFVRVTPPAGAVWKQGMATAAALFVERAVRHAPAGTEILGLLPEVLRTGSSYQAWREHIDTMAHTEQIQRVGLFSRHADVDVYFQRWSRRAAASAVPPKRRSTPTDTVAGHFSIKVGPVVPHRHPHDGPSRAFLHAGNASPWESIKRIGEQRRFAGTLYRPPFVVIRRTSRPGDPNRATASLVLGVRPVAVENHLIIALPIRGGEPICRKLVRLLASPRTDARLDRVMRCRHLTVGSIMNILWTG